MCGRDPHAVTGLVSGGQDLFFKAFGGFCGSETPVERPGGRRVGPPCLAAYKGTWLKR